MKCEQKCRALLPGGVSEPCAGGPVSLPLSREDVVHAHKGSLVGWGPRMTTAQKRAAATLHGWAGDPRPGGQVLADNTRGCWQSVRGSGGLFPVLGCCWEQWVTSVRCLGLRTRQVLGKRWAPSGLGVSAHRPDLPPPRLRDRLPRLWVRTAGFKQPSGEPLH